jgi:Carboxyltransferase domain, subdomain A and B
VKFHVAAVVALTGAEFDAKLDDKPVPCWTSFAVAAGTTLAIGMVITTCLPASCYASSLQIIVSSFILVFGLLPLSTPSTLLLVCVRRRGPAGHGAIWQ